MVLFSQLRERVSQDAEVLRRYGAAARAEAAETVTGELERLMRAWLDELLDMRTSMAESGYSTSALRSMVREGVIVNRGQPGEFLLRRGDLPRKPGHPLLEGLFPAAAPSEADVAPDPGVDIEPERTPVAAPLAPVPASRRQIARAVTSREG